MIINTRMIATFWNNDNDKSDESEDADIEIGLLLL
jgi:hypothetical protein